MTDDLAKTAAADEERRPRRDSQDADQSTPGPMALVSKDRDDVAPRRTLMAAERTYLAWLRTGLAALGAAIAVGRIVPSLLGGSHYAYVVLGAGYAALGIFLIAYALVRARRLDAALAANRSVDLDWWALAITTAIGIFLAVVTIVMVLLEV